MDRSTIPYMDALRARTSRATWKWSIGVWLAFGVLDSLQNVFEMHAEGMHHIWAKVFLTTILYWVPWAVTTPFMLRFARRFPIAQRRSWSVHFAYFVVGDLIFAVWCAALQFYLHPYSATQKESFRHLLQSKVLDGTFTCVIFYGVILTIGAALESRRRLAEQQTETARLNEQLSTAQLDSLRRQIEPHFLFNTLNSIAGLVREQRNDAAVNMIAGLSDLLRRSLDGSPHQQVPLCEEMEFAQKYLDIQKMRFADRLRISTDIPLDLYPAQVPSLILQPMVENAIKHGIAHRAQGGTIHIAASRQNGTLTLRVSNDGPGLAPGWETANPGIGISNVRTRLQSLYGEASDLTLRNQPTGGVEVALSLPFVTAPVGMTSPRA